jgi:hypothetical protein
MLLALANTSSHAQTGSLAPTGPASQIAVFEIAKDAVKEKGEVDLKLAELSARHELVLFVCVEASKCKPLKKGQTVAGHLLKEEPKRGKAVNLPQPAYPAMARAAHASGAVKV